MTTTEYLTQAALSRNSSAVAFIPAHIPWSESGRGRSTWGPFYEIASLYGGCIWPVGMEKGSWQATVVNFSIEREKFVPRTALGAKLLSLRNRAIASGMRLLSEEEVLEEVRRRRGELENGEADVS